MPIGPKNWTPPKISPREGSRDFRRWYSWAIWCGEKGLRRQQLSREPFCAVCLAIGRRETATDVDHIIPHRGDWRLFTLESNLRSLCHRCHSEKTGRGY